MTRRANHRVTEDTETAEAFQPAKRAQYDTHSLASAAGSPPRTLFVLRPP